jgi:hypothetical protein
MNNNNIRRKKNMSTYTKDKNSDESGSSCDGKLHKRKHKRANKVQARHAQNVRQQCLERLARGCVTIIN